MHGLDGAVMVAQEAAETFSSPLISNARVSNGPFQHVLTTPKGNVQDYGRSNTREFLGCDKGSFQGRNKGESAEDTTLVCPAICGNIGLPNKVMQLENPLDKANNHGCDGRSSQGLKAGGKPDGAASIIPARCGISEMSIIATHGGSPLDKPSDQGHDGRSSQGIKEGGNSAFVTPSSPANCSKELYVIVLLGQRRNIHGEAVRAVQDMTATKNVFPDLIYGSKGLSLQAKNGEHPLGSWIHGSEGRPSISMQKAESVVGAATFCRAMCGNSVRAKRA
ncbi:hypothetical protein F0562_012029 [Nyssa sinensis]|uniref:Uncharacterized protein n=1 Tax=Nyssa sinensis TaxID=561372 RepID=A0A5J4ZVB6_9ASTE|nr:hypothetical protein F0562_012029 [Nyssa sinensis]